MRIVTVALLALLGSLFTGPVIAYESGDLLLRAGLLTSDPDAEGQELGNQDLEVADDTMPAFSVSYMVHEYVGLQFATSLPLTHNILLDDSSGAGSGNVGETGVISPNATVQVHAPAFAGFHPWLGLGVHYSAFFEEDFRNQNARGIPADYQLELDSSTGLITQLGVDMEVGDNWYVNGSVSQLRLETTATVTDSNGFVGEEDIDLDPLQWQIGVAYRF